MSSTINDRSMEQKDEKIGKSLKFFIKFEYPQVKLNGTKIEIVDELI